MQIAALGIFVSPSAEFSQVFPGTRSADTITHRLRVRRPGTQNAGVQIDLWTNVWAANNWKTDPFPQNTPAGTRGPSTSGAAPLRTPLIGPEEPLRLEPRRGKGSIPPVRQPPPLGLRTPRGAPDDDNGVDVGRVTAIATVDVAAG